jgi:hypothetical protein
LATLRDYAWHLVLHYLIQGMHSQSPSRHIWLLYAPLTSNWFYEENECRVWKLCADIPIAILSTI